MLIPAIVKCAWVRQINADLPPPQHRARHTTVSQRLGHSNVRREVRTQGRIEGESIDLPVYDPTRLPDYPIKSGSNEAVVHPETAYPASTSSITIRVPESEPQQDVRFAVPAGDNSQPPPPTLSYPPSLLNKEMSRHAKSLFITPLTTLIPPLNDHLHSQRGLARDTISESTHAPILGFLSFWTS